MGLRKQAHLDAKQISQISVQRQYFPLFLAEQALAATFAISYRRARFGHQRHKRVESR